MHWWDVKDLLISLGSSSSAPLLDRRVIKGRAGNIGASTGQMSGLRNGTDGFEHASTDSLPNDVLSVQDGALERPMISGGGVMSKCVSFDGNGTVKNMERVILNLVD